MVTSKDMEKLKLAVNCWSTLPPSPPPQEKKPCQASQIARLLDSRSGLR